MVYTRSNYLSTIENHCTSIFFRITGFKVETSHKEQTIKIIGSFLTIQLHQRFT